MEIKEELYRSPPRQDLDRERREDFWRTYMHMYFSIKPIPPPLLPSESLCRRTTTTTTTTTSNRNGDGKTKTETTTPNFQGWLPWNYTTLFSLEKININRNNDDEGKGDRLSPVGYYSGDLGTTVNRAPPDSYSLTEKFNKTVVENSAGQDRGGVWSERMVDRRNLGVERHKLVRGRRTVIDLGDVGML